MELMEFKLSSDQKTLLEYSGYAETVIIPDGIEEIDAYAFAHCYLERIEIPDSVIAIGNSAFQGCVDLTYVRLPKTLLTIAESTFEDCPSLKEIHFPELLTSISPKAFKGCCNLAEIRFPDSLQNIGGSAFEDCENLSSVFFPKNIQYIAENAFENTCLIDMGSQEGRMRYHKIPISEFGVPEIGQIISVPMKYGYYYGDSDLHGKLFRLAVGILTDELYILDCIPIGPHPGDWVKIMGLSHFVFQDWIKQQELLPPQEARLYGLEQKHWGCLRSYRDGAWMILEDSLGGGDLRYRDYIYCSPNGIDYLVFLEGNWDVIWMPENPVLGNHQQRLSLLEKNSRGISHE